MALSPKILILPLLLVLLQGSTHASLFGSSSSSSSSASPSPTPTPEETDSALCNACHAIVHQAVKLKGDHSEKSVTKFMENVCDEKTLADYHVEKLATYCKTFLEQYKDKIRPLLNKADNADAEYEVCHNTLPVCKGVHYTRPGYSDPASLRRDFAGQVYRVQEALEKGYDKMTGMLPAMREKTMAAMHEAMDWLKENTLPDTETVKSKNASFWNSSRDFIAAMESSSAHDRLSNMTSYVMNLLSGNNTDEDSKLTDTDEKERTGILEKIKEVQEWLSDPMNKTADMYLEKETDVKKMFNSVSSQVMSGMIGKALNATGVLNNTKKKIEL